MEQKEFRAGFVSIIGKPNVGKSTLMNRLVGESLSIVSPKEQTTRHRIMGIINGPDHQIVYSDTPGMLEPKYTLHEAMMNYVKVSLQDADLILLIVDLNDKYVPSIFDKFKKIETPIILVLNKTDLSKGSQAYDKMLYWKEQFSENIKDYLEISALAGTNVDNLLQTIINYLPIHPPYFPQDELTNRPERFFASEMIRESIFLNYEQEVPYSTEVVVTEFMEEPDIIRIRGEIYVERDSQKGIIIGKGGSTLKKVGQQSREAMEAFFKKKVFLETYVKVAKNWRKEKSHLKHFGYLE